MPHPPGFAEALHRLERELEVLPDKPDETPEATLRALWALAGGEPLSLAQSRSSQPGVLDGPALTTLGELLEQRLSGVPLAHLTGRQDFMGLVLKTSPAALVPRKETELLARHALTKLEASPGPGALVLDVCCGCGNVTLAVAVHGPAARVLGADLDEGAVALARENATWLERPDVEFRVGDLLAPFDEPGFVGQVDLITCNPPYISSSRVPEMPREISSFEPTLAFDGGSFGVTILRRLAAEAPRWLRSGGWLVSEIGEGQGSTMARLLQRSPDFDTVETVEDAAGTVRVVAARRTRR